VAGPTGGRQHGGAVGLEGSGCHRRRKEGSIGGSARTVMGATQMKKTIV
jgi:hypothetical protein